MRVLLAEETYRLINPFFECRRLGQMTVEGRPGAVNIYQVQQARPAPGHARTLVDVVSPMVGRDAELDTLRQLADTVRAGLGRAVLIMGEPGMGKTRLVNEWQLTDATLHWAEGASPSFGQDQAYTLIAALLRSLLGIPTTATEPEVRTALHTTVEGMFADDTFELFPYLGHLLSITLEDPMLERVRLLPPQALKAQYLAALKRLLVALATRSPLLLVLEDLQWADPSSIELLTMLMPLATSAPILFCLVTRPERNRAGWRLVTAGRDIMGDRLTELNLRPLSEAEGEQIISNLVADRTLPPRIRRLILRQAEGNPFFIEEVLHMLSDQGAVDQGDGSWQIDDAIKTPDIPGSLQGLFQARIDHLPEHVRHTLRVASVIGRQFSAPVLERVIGDAGQKATLSNDLGTLETAGLIHVVQVKPELTYRFRHILLQEAVYASLLPADRQRLHHIVARTMVSVYADRVGQIAPLLAHHFLQAGDNDQAVIHLLRAGDAELASFANQEAEAHYRQALGLIRSVADRAELFSALGQALFGQGRFEDAVHTWRQGISAYQAGGHPDSVARLYARSARATWSGGSTPEALRLCQEGLAAVADAPPSPGVALLLHEAARAYLFNGLVAEARQLGQQALAMAEELDVVAVQVEVLATLGLMSDQSPEAAQAALNRAIDLATSPELVGQAARAHLNLAALLATNLPDLPAARDHYRRAAELHSASGNKATQILALGGMTGVLLLLGQFEQVDATLKQMETLASERVDPGPGTYSLRCNGAQLLRFRGEFAQAYRCLKELQQEERQKGNLHNLIETNAQLVETALESALLSSGSMVCDWDETEATLAETLEACERWDVKAIFPTCLLSQIRAHHGELVAARQALNRAKEVARSEPSLLDEGWLLISEARVATVEGRRQGAQSAFEAAAETFARLGMQWWQARTLLAWAKMVAASQELADLERARLLLQKAAPLFAGMGVPFYHRLAVDRMLVVERRIVDQVSAYQRLNREMAQAGRMQEGLLPSVPADLPGYQLAATLEPSRQTSGDFYDFIPLPGDRLGLVIADVSDKGAAAALFMALSRSLIRTYAAEFAADPVRVLDATNQRIFADTRTDLFVTLFYAILDSASGELTYCSAGHDPPYLFRSTSPAVAATLSRTGIPLGVVESWAWESRNIHLLPGDTLVLYTDGITDANDTRGAFFGRQRLIASAQSALGQPAERVRDQILADVRAFATGAPQHDDIALLVLTRQPA